MTKIRWLAFLILLPVTGLLTLIVSPVGELLRPFCPQGFWRKALMFGSDHCGYAPVSILAGAVEFASAILVSLLCILIIPRHYRFRTARVLLLLWICFPVAIGLWQGLSWSSLAEFAVAIFLWLIFAVLATVWPNDSLKPTSKRDIGHVPAHPT